MRIVLVDPSRAIQHAMTDLIVQGGHEVASFCEGLKALEHLKLDASARALVTSIQLPDISGLELCVTARKFAGSRRALFIIVMSSSEDFGQVVRALDNGADDFIRKPPLAEELRARLRAADRVTTMQCEMIRYATTDFLTGLLNRRTFFEDGTEACQMAHIDGSLSAILFDIDHFKTINDTYGHEAGDVVLAGVGAAAKTAANGIVGRLGGEEFCVLAHCGRSDAIGLAEALRGSLGRLRFPKCPSVSVTCSFGVTEWERGDTIDLLLQRADFAMYEAKRAGRDGVVAVDALVPTDWQDDRRGVVRSAMRT